MKPNKNLGMLDHDQVARAHALLDVVLKSKGIGRRELRDALQRGLGKALHSGHPGAWGCEETDPAGNAAGRLLHRLAGELLLPLSGLVGPTAIGVAEELVG